MLFIIKHHAKCSHKRPHKLARPMGTVLYVSQGFGILQIQQQLKLFNIESEIDNCVVAKHASRITFVLFQLPILGFTS